MISNFSYFENFRFRTWSGRLSLLLSFVLFLLIFSLILKSVSLFDEYQHYQQVKLKERQTFLSVDIAVQQQKSAINAELSDFLFKVDQIANYLDSEFPEPSVWLAHLEQLIPKQVELQTIEFSADTGLYKVIGKTADRSNISNFMSSVENSAWFESSSLIQQQQTGDWYEFTLQMGVAQ